MTLNAPEMPDGIYFDMPHEIYVKLRRLGSSSLTDLRTSPATFWHKSWMNPNRDPDQSKGRDPKAIGTAYHMARLEPDRFPEVYARGFDENLHPDMLTNDTQVSDRLGEMGEVKKPKGENTLARALRLNSDPRFDGEIRAVLELEHETSIEGRIPLPPDIYDGIEQSGAQLRQTPAVATLLQGGAPEVSILWTSPCGVPLRARIDYLRADGWVDLKTYSNPYSKPVEQCVIDAFRFNRNYVQAGFYDMAIEAVRRNPLPVSMCGHSGNLPEKEASLIDAIENAAAPLQCHFIFCESNGSPNVMAREIMLRDRVAGDNLNGSGATDVAEFMTKPTRLMMKAEREIDFSLRVFKWASETFLDGEPWGPRDPFGRIDDADYHDNFFEGDGR